MKNPATPPPGSGPTVAAPEARARDTETGRFAATDGWGRSPAEREVIARRRAKVEELYPTKTAAEIANELRCSPATIAKDVVKLAALGKLEIRRPGPRQRHPDPIEKTCEGCGKPFTPESWEPDRRYCTHPCSQRSNRSVLVRETARKLLAETHRRAAVEVARLNEDGWLTARQVAKERKVTEPAVSRWITAELLTAELRIIEGERHRLVRREELDRFNREEWPRIIERMGPGLPTNWGGERRRLWSRRLRAPLVGKLGGLTAAYSDRVARLVHDLKAEDPNRGRETIPRIVASLTGETITPKQVRGILAKPRPVGPSEITRP